MDVVVFRLTAVHTTVLETTLHVESERPIPGIQRLKQQHNENSISNDNQAQGV